MASTMSEALRECFAERGGVVTKQDVEKWFARHYAGRWADGTLRDHLYGGRVNHPLAYKHHPGQKKFLYDHGGHRYELYDASRHGLFREGARVRRASKPGWILIHSTNPRYYGPGKPFASPMAELADEDAASRSNVRWHWKLNNPPAESRELRRILLAWHGKVFGEALAEVSHIVTLQGHDFSFILKKYNPVTKPIPLGHLKLGSRAKNHRGLIKLETENLEAFDRIKESEETAVITDLIEGLESPGLPSRKWRRRFLANAAERKAIELHAMHVARKFLKKKRFKAVRNVSKNQPFDFVARKDGRHYIIEVKGSTGLGEEIILTRNEVEAHSVSHPRNVLVIVHSIQLDRSAKHPTASGGIARGTVGWEIEHKKLFPLSFSYRLSP